MFKGVLVMLDLVEVWDRLSIYEIKHAIAKETKLKISEQITDLESRIIKRIGFKLYHKIKLSKYYHELVEANQAVFDGVNKSRKKEISGFDLNRLNEIRSEKKKNLNIIFFGDEMGEVKIDENGERI